MKEISVIARILGQLFYYSPSHSIAANLMVELTQPQFHAFRPLIKSWITTDRHDLERDHHLLFSGGDMPAPPWASVYLDEKQDVFGQANTAYKKFMSQHHLPLFHHSREPEDHFGLMLLAIADLSKQDKTETVIVLCEQHLFTWSSCYLLQMKQHAKTCFFQDLAIFTIEWLSNLQRTLALKPLSVPIYL